MQIKFKTIKFKVGKENCVDFICGICAEQAIIPDNLKEYKCKKCGYVYRRK